MVEEALLVTIYLLFTALVALTIITFALIIAIAVINGFINFYKKKGACS